MVDPERVRSLLALYRRYRAYLVRLAERSDEELRDDFALMGAIQHYLLLTMESVLDLGSHVISTEGYAPPASYADIFPILWTRIGFSGSCGNLSLTSTSSCGSCASASRGSWGRPRTSGCSSSPRPPLHLLQRLPRLVNQVAKLLPCSFYRVAYRLRSS